MRSAIRIVLITLGLVLTLLGLYIFVIWLVGPNSKTNSASFLPPLPSVDQTLDAEALAQGKRLEAVWKTLYLLTCDSNTTPGELEEIRSRARRRLPNVDNSRALDIHLMMALFPATEQGVQSLLDLRERDGELREKLLGLSTVAGALAAELPPDSPAVKRIWRFVDSPRVEDQELFCGWARLNHGSDQLAPFIDRMAEFQVAWARRSSCEWILRNRDMAQGEAAYARALADKELTEGEVVYLSGVYLEHGGLEQATEAIRRSFAFLEQEGANRDMLGPAFMKCLRFDEEESAGWTWDQAVAAEPRAIEILALTLTVEGKAKHYFTPVSRLIRHGCFSPDELQDALPPDLTPRESAQFEESMLYVESEVELGS